VVEQQVDEEVIAAHFQVHLLPDKGKACAQLQQKLFEPVNDGGFQVGFGIASFLVKAEEFQDVRLFEDVRRRNDDLSLAGKPLDLFLVFAEGETFVEA